MKRYAPKEPTKIHWELVGPKHHHGLCIPIFSLHTKESCGIGEYPDLLPIIDWIKELGMDTIQLLPVNDTGDEISPYSPISAMALNPLYLGLTRLPNFKNSISIQKLKKLNKVQYIDYETIKEDKEKLLREYYRTEFQKIRLTKTYNQFIKSNPWIKIYAQYKNKDDIHYPMFLQFLCFQQLKEVKRYADKKGVFLKGDLPILIAPHSVDVESNPQLFDTTLSAGAPPDQYNQEGQNWGFPLYRWSKAKEDILLWWKQRLQFQENFFHLYRIDHVVGLFRIWTIQKGTAAVDGQFIPKDRRKWIPQGKSILNEFLAQTKMLPIAEDLGTVPPSVRSCLLELGIPGTKVMRWESIPPEKYPPESMTTVSTHDTETMYQWWSKHPQEAKQLASILRVKYKKNLTKETAQAILRLSHQSGSFFHINLLQEYFPLVPELCWGKPEEERINRPDRNSYKNWRYRYKKNVEALISHPELKEKIKSIIHDSV